MRSPALTLTSKEETFESSKAKSTRVPLSGAGRVVAAFLSSVQCWLQSTEYL